MTTESVRAAAPTAPGARQCAACGSADAAPLFRGLVVCSACGLVYFPRRLTADEVRRLYATEYFRGAEYFDYPADRRVHEANFRARVRDLLPWVSRGDGVFEIGCSYGFFLHVARRHWAVAGCDVAADPCEFARKRLGLDVRCGEFPDLPLRRGDYHAFCLWDTIEHLDAPDTYLARIAELLPPGGIVALTTGDIGSWLARRQGPRWRQIHPPTHLWYFSRATMKRALERFGFEMVAFRHVGVARSVGQIVYSLTSLGKDHPSGLHRLCVYSGFGKLPVWINTGDLMMVVGRRRA